MAYDRGKSVDPAQHPWFEEWQEPESGIKSYILRERVAPFQRAGYHTARSTSIDGRYIWFTATFPPSLNFCLAAARLDADGPEIKLFPHCPISIFGGSPLLSPQGDEAIVVIGEALYRQPFDGAPELLFHVGGFASGWVYRLCTHLSQSCDGRYYVLDAHVGNAFYILLVDCKTGETEILKRFYHNHHHTLFSPVDPNLILVGQGPWLDPVTGQRGNEDLRAWIMSVDGTRYDPIMADIYQRGPNAALHEFWEPNGRVAWCHIRDGLFDADMNQPANHRDRVHIWKGRGLTHAHCNADATLFCGDTNPYSWDPDKPCGVYFFNRDTGRDVAIAHLPYPDSIPLREKRQYHFDPHPFFSADGRHVIYTSTVLDRLDIAFTPVADLVEATEN